MNCCKQIDDFLDGDLVGAEREAFVAAARDCAECREAIQANVAIDATLKAAWQEVVVPELTQEVSSADAESLVSLNDRRDEVSRSTKESIRPLWWKSSTRWAAFAACLAVMSIIGWGILQAFESRSSHEMAGGDEGPTQVKSRHSSDVNIDERADEESESSIMATNYDNKGITISGPYLGYKAIDDDDLTLVMIYPSATDFAENESEETVGENID